MIKILKSKILLLFIVSSFLIFYMSILYQNKGIIIDNKEVENERNNSYTSTTFTNVEYNFDDKKNRNYNLVGKEAIIDNKNPELIKLKVVNATTKLKDNTLLKITSQEADFLKFKKDIFFKKNVVIMNKDMIIKSENANFFHKKQIIEVFGNVYFKNTKNLIKCDRLIYELNNKNIIVEMISKNKQVYGKRQN